MRRRRRESGGAPTAASAGRTDPPDEQPAEVVAESRWPMAGAVLAAMVLTVLRPADLRLGPAWLLPAVEAVLLVALLAGEPGRIDRLSSALRALSIGLVSVLAVDALWSTVRLIDALVHGGAGTNSAGGLLAAGSAVWIANNLAAALLYWELDGGGSAARAHRGRSASISRSPSSSTRAWPRLAGGPTSSTTSTWRSPTRPRSARRT